MNDMVVHNELSGSYTGPKDKSKQLSERDIINRMNDVTHRCIGFEVPINIVIDNKPFTQTFYFKRNEENQKIWQVTTLLGDGGKLGDVPLRIMYEIPNVDFPLVKIAAMGLLYTRLSQMERMAYYETLNYELLEVTEGL